MSEVSSSELKSNSDHSWNKRLMIILYHNPFTSMVSTLGYISKSSSSGSYKTIKPISSSRKSVLGFFGICSTTINSLLAVDGGLISLCQHLLLKMDYLYFIL